jgi:hypothetical protein
MMLYHLRYIFVIDNNGDNKLQMDLILKVTECSVRSMFSLHSSGSILRSWVSLTLQVPCYSCVTGSTVFLMRRRIALLALWLSF